MARQSSFLVLTGSLLLWCALFASLSWDSIGHAQSCRNVDPDTRQTCITDDGVNTQTGFYGNSHVWRLRNACNRTISEVIVERLKNGLQHEWHEGVPPRNALEHKCDHWGGCTGFAGYYEKCLPPDSDQSANDNANAISSPTVPSFDELDAALNSSKKAATAAENAIYAANRRVEEERQRQFSEHLARIEEQERQRRLEQDRLDRERAELQAAIELDRQRRELVRRQIEREIETKGATGGQSFVLTGYVYYGQGDFQGCFAGASVMSTCRSRCQPLRETASGASCWQGRVEQMATAGQKACLTNLCEGNSDRKCVPLAEFFNR
jgi:hypothetical protein